MIKASFIFVFFIMVTSCATTLHTLPEKYNLDNYLKKVNQISVLKVKDYENIDNQSIILEADHNNYFLLVLRRPIDMKYSNISIDVENTVSMDRAHSTQEIIGPKTTAGSRPNTEFVQGPSTMVGIAAGHDRIIVTESAYTRYYIIERIYKLKGWEQAEEIKEWLRRN